MMTPGGKVRGYEVVERVVGGKSLTAKVTDATGETLFLKQFSTPKYPVDTAGKDPARVAKLIKICDVFEARHRSVMKRLAAVRPGGGNLVKPIDFFRDGAGFYKVYPFVTGEPSTIVASRPATDQELFAKTLVLCVRELHIEDIVHGDLKPDNVLAESKPAGLVSRLIDFDEAYVSGSPLGALIVGGDPVYYSPELQRYVDGREDLAPSLSVKSDIFALGLLIHRLFVGSLPSVDGGTGDSHARRILTNGRVELTEIPSLPGEFNRLLRRALAPDPADRPDIEHLARALGLPSIDNPPSRVRTKMRRPT
jgi:serine/threonine protein kinase